MADKVKGEDDVRDEAGDDSRPETEDDDVQFVGEVRMQIPITAYKPANKDKKDGEEESAVPRHHFSNEALSQALSEALVAMSEVGPSSMGYSPGTLPPVDVPSLAGEIV
jgi:hypothetical protein